MDHSFFTGGHVPTIDYILSTLAFSDHPVSDPYRSWSYLSRAWGGMSSAPHSEVTHPSSEF